MGIEFDKQSEIVLLLESASHGLWNILQKKLIISLKLKYRVLNQNYIFGIVRFYVRVCY